MGLQVSLRSLLLTLAATLRIIYHCQPKAFEFMKKLSRHGKMISHQITLEVSILSRPRVAIDHYYIFRLTCLTSVLCISGLSPGVLDAVEPDDLADICSLHVALGCAFNGAGRHVKSALSFHNALRVSRFLIILLHWLFV